MQQSRQEWRAQVFVMPRHRPIFDLSPKAISHYEFITFAPLVYEALRFRKVMAAIGITQNNKLATGLINASPQCASVTLNCRT